MPTPTAGLPATPTPAASADGTLAPASTPTPASADGAPAPAPTPIDVPDAPERDWFALVERYLGITPTPLPEGTLYADEPAGTSRSFFVLDITAPSITTVDASLRYVSEHALWYVTDGLDIPQRELEATARRFDDLVFDAVMRTFAPLARVPGRITILNAEPPALAGYFQSADALPTAAFQYSNERVMLVMNGAGLGSDRYLGTLAHELQHLASWLVDPTEQTWIAEGLAELSAALLDLPAFSYRTYLNSPGVSLANWPDDPRDSASAYSGASLFSRYLSDRFGTESLQRLVAQPLDGADGVQAFLDELGVGITFAELFGDWLVANVVAATEGRFAYDDAPGTARIEETLGPDGHLETTVRQIGGTYVRVDPQGTPVRVTFDGDSATPLIPVAPHGGDSCWWSNRGDSIDSTLTRELDLTGLRSATLRFWSWYDIEMAFDHAYVAVSTDGGVRWRLLEGAFTSSDDPTGSSLGHSYSGQTQGWREDAMDLTPYAGTQVLLRFNYVTDESIDNAGWCVDDVSVPELGYTDDAESPGDWDARGFVRITTAGTRQDFVVRIVTGSGNTAVVSDVTLDDNNDATFVIDEPAVIVVGGLTPKAAVPARFRLTTSTP